MLHATERIELWQTPGKSKVLEAGLTNDVKHTSNLANQK